MSSPKDKSNKPRLEANQRFDPNMLICVLCNADYKWKQNRFHPGHCPKCEAVIANLRKKYPLTHNATQDFVDRVMEVDIPGMGKCSSRTGAGSTKIEEPALSGEGMTTEENKVIGSRDTKGKPPRHFFYVEGLSVLLDQGGVKGKMISSIVKRVDSIINSLSEGTFKVAEIQIKEILEDLQILYENEYLTKRSALIADSSYVVRVGAVKYGHTNYRKGLPFSCCISSFMGHFISYCLGEKDNTEKGPNGEILHVGPNLQYCAANMLILLGYVGNKEVIEKCNDIPDMFKEPLYK